MVLYQLTLKDILELYEAIRKKGKWKVSEPDFITAMSNRLSQSNIDIKEQDRDMIHIKMKNVYQKILRFMDKPARERRSCDLKSVWFEYKPTALTVDADNLSSTVERQKSPLDQVSIRHNKCQSGTTVKKRSARHLERNIIG